MNAGPLLSAGLTDITTINALYMVLHMTLDKLVVKKLGSTLNFSESRLDPLGVNLNPCHIDMTVQKFVLKFSGYNLSIASLCSCFFISSASKTGQEF